MPPDPPDNILPFRGAAPAASDPSWIGRLAKNEKGGWLPTLANALLILEYDPPLVGMFAFNLMSCEPLLTRQPPIADDGLSPLGGTYPRPWESPDVSMVQAYLQRVWASRFGRDTTEQAMVAVAARNAFHPVRIWLDSLQWSGAPRLDTWLTQAFGTPDDNYHAAVGAKFLIGAIRRVRQPGCKFDHMLILEGNQDIGKSFACRELFAPWFSDSIPSDLGSRDAALTMAGPWCIELGEIDALIRSETETVKAFLSRQTDRFRPPYERNIVQRPRQCVLIGTTNSDDYLRDATGNRRFWPVKCSFVDLDWLRSNREQLFAEAAIRETSGEITWLSETETSNIAKKEQEERLPDDTWLEPIDKWLAFKTEVSLAELLGEALLIPAERQGKREQMRAAITMRKLGWNRIVKKEDKRGVRKWAKDKA